MLDSEHWTTETKKLTVNHRSKGNGIEILRGALADIALELGDPTIEEVDIVVSYDQINGSTIEITIGR